MQQVQEQHEKTWVVLGPHSWVSKWKADKILSTAAGQRGQGAAAAGAAAGCAGNSQGLCCQGPAAGGGQYCPPARTPHGQVWVHATLQGCLAQDLYCSQAVQGAGRSWTAS